MYFFFLCSSGENLITSDFMSHFHLSILKFRLRFILRSTSVQYVSYKLFIFLDQIFVINSYWSLTYTTDEIRGLRFGTIFFTIGTS